jgi:DNA-binding MarR family transcriptional regulator
MTRLSDPQVHDDLLNYQLKRLVTLGGAPAIRLCEGEFGMARSEWRLMAALVEGGPLSPTALAARARMERARVSRLLTVLMEKGLVLRSDSGRDARRAVLSATPRSFEIYARLFPKLADINRRLMAVLSDEEAQVLEACLSRLTQRAQEIYDAGGGVDARADRWRGGGHRGVRA